MSNQGQASKPPPPGWPRISSAVFYEDPAAAIDWLCEAFGFQVALKVEGPNGEILHSQLTLGDGLIMVAGTANLAQREDPVPSRSPQTIDGGITQALLVQIDDVDAHCAHARAAGAAVLDEPTTTDHGAEYWADRMYRAADCEGHQWWFSQRVRGPGA